MVLKILKRGVQLALIPLAVSAVVLVLLALVYLLPTAGMKAHVGNTLGNFEKEGMYFYSLTGEAGADQDNFIEALYLDQAIVGTEDADLMSCVLSGYDYVYKDASDTIGNLTKAVTEPDSVTIMDTERRFFNGQVIILKPLLTVMGYTGVRTFCLYSCVLGTAWFFWLLHRRGFGRFILPALLAILFLRPVTAWTGIAFTLIYACMLIPCIVMLLVKKETLQEKAWLIFGVTGAVTFCFNMNYFQLLSFCIPFLVYMLITGIPEKSLGFIRILADWFIAWMAGYGGAMLIKWILYAIVIDGSIFKTVTDRMAERTGLYEVTRFGTVIKNVGIAFGSLWWDLAELGFIGFTVVRWIRKKEKISFSVAEILLLLAALLIPLGRFVLFANHSDQHAGFVYRLLMMPVLAVNWMLTKKSSDERVLR